MKKLFFTVVAVLAFSGAGFAKDQEVNKVCEIAIPSCCGTYEGYYAILIHHGISSNMAGDMANAMEERCEKMRTQNRKL